MRAALKPTDSFSITFAPRAALPSMSVSPPFLFLLPRGARGGNGTYYSTYLWNWIYPEHSCLVTIYPILAGARAQVPDELNHGNRRRRVIEE